MKFAVVVPARLGSTRLPRKVLRPLAGKPLLQWTWEAANTCGAAAVIIATDSEEIAEVCRGFGAEVRLTAATHNSGTDRVNEVAEAEGWNDDDVVVNLQGDEPLMPPALVLQVARLLVDDAGADIATLAHPLHTQEEWFNPNFVKVVLDEQGRALYFSRAPIPWKRVGSEPVSPLPEGLALRHVGLYAYRVGALRRFSAWPSAPLEECEALEQLRALSHGLRIRVGQIETTPPRGVDTEADLLVAEAILSSH